MALFGMLNVIFTLDYEIHGNGDGCPYELMVEPTDRMLRLFDRYSAKLTIMADIGEILKFREYKERIGRDDYHYDKIVAQLRQAVRTGHDVQLHIHSSYFNATHDGHRWVQDWSEYNFAGLPLDRMTEMVRIGKEFLESILRPVKPDYRCFAFRAANWSVSPSQNVVKALLANDITIDTSVFKYGKRSGIVNFDYSNAYSDLMPWPASAEDICQRDDSSQLWEYPIYCERRWLGAFLTPNRVYRAVTGRAHRIHNGSRKTGAHVLRSRTPGSRIIDRIGVLTRCHAWKADFNQCTGRQLVNACLRASCRNRASSDVPFVLIGHSKLFNRLNERSLEPFLQHAGRTGEGCKFGVFFANACAAVPSSGRVV